MKEKEQMLRENLKGVKTVVIDIEDEYKKSAEMLGGKVLCINPNTVGNFFFNPLEIKEESITKGKIIECVKLNIEARKALNMDITPENILKEMCSVNNVELLESDITEILNNVNKIVYPFNIDLNKGNYNCVSIGSLGDGAKCNNYLELGKMGEGKGIHPWDNLISCECGGSPWMEGKNDDKFEAGESNRIRCRKCGKHTEYGNVQEIKNEWNNM